MDVSIQALRTSGLFFGITRLFVMDPLVFAGQFDCLIGMGCTCSNGIAVDSNGEDSPGACPTCFVHQVCVILFFAYKIH